MDFERTLKAAEIGLDELWEKFEGFAKGVVGSATEETWQVVRTLLEREGGLDIQKEMMDALEREERDKEEREKEDKKVKGDAKAVVEDFKFIV